MLPNRSSTGRVLVVGDGLDVEGAMLIDAGFEVTAIGDSRKLRQVVDTARPDVVLLEINQPAEAASDACRRMRRLGLSTPIAVVAPRCRAADHARNLDAGADDFITTPVAFDELRARAQALARRGLWHSSPVIKVGDVDLDASRRTVTRDSVAVQLTATEYSILELLLRNVDVVLERSTIYERIWGVDFTGTSKSLDVHVGTMRRKLEAHGPRVVQTVRGVGYVIWSESTQPGHLSDRE